MDARQPRADSARNTLIGTFFESVLTQAWPATTAERLEIMDEHINDVACRTEIFDVARRMVRGDDMLIEVEIDRLFPE